MAKNPVVEVVNWFEGVATTLAHLSEKVWAILKREKALQPEFVSGIRLLLTDVQELVAEGELIYTEKGLVFAEDSKGYAAFKKLVTDIKAFSPVVEHAVANLK
jgi:hypothetical protein